MFVTGDQVTAGLPGADRVDQAPRHCQRYIPQREIQHRREWRVTTHDAVPGHQVRLFRQCGQVPDGRCPSAGILYEEEQGQNGDRREQQKHQCVGQDHSTRSRIHRERRIADPADNQRLSETEISNVREQKRHTLGDRQQVAAQTENNGNTRSHLHAM